MLVSEIPILTELDAPSVPILVALMLASLTGAAGRAFSRGAISGAEGRACAVLVVVMAVWVTISSALAASGAYVHPVALRFLPLLCGFLVPPSILAVGLWISPLLRSGVAGVVWSVPLPWLVGVQSIRITALGTIIKFLDGDLPGHFILPVGVPDFLVGRTALPMALWTSRNPTSARPILVIWNIAGAAIFLPAGILMHASMPGPVQLFASGPTTASLFQFPLALVPTFLVPCFVGVHVACLWRLRAIARPAP